MSTKSNPPETAKAAVFVPVSELYMRHLLRGNTITIFYHPRSNATIVEGDIILVRGYSARKEKFSQDAAYARVVLAYRVNPPDPNNSWIKIILVLHEHIIEL